MSMEKVYNKLVRDKIPEIIENDGHIPVVRILDDVEYKKELEKKLYEEYLEVLNTRTKEERIEELSDMLEIISYLANLDGKTLKDVIIKAKEKKLTRGGFDKKLFLEKEIRK